MEKDITFFIGSIGGGGAERVICELASYMATNNYHVKILTLTDTENKYPISSKIEYYSLDKDIVQNKKIKKIIQKIFRLCVFIKKNYTDCYIVFLPETIILVTLLRWMIKCPVIISERNDPTSYNKFVQLLMLNAAKRNEGIVFQTAFAQTFYEKKVRRLNGMVIPNAVKTEFLDPYMGKRDNRIVSVGRFNSQKNFPLLIKAFAIVSKKLPQYEMTIYGEGDTKSICIELSKKLGILDKINFAGFSTDIKEKIKNAAVFVLPSDYEGIPNALMEAMALGIPCISTDCKGGGAKLLIGNNKNGILVRRNDPVQMAAAIEEILTNKVLAAEISTNAANFMKTYNPSQIYGIWIDYIEKYLT